MLYTCFEWIVPCKQKKKTLFLLAISPTATRDQVLNEFLFMWRNSSETARTSISNNLQIRWTRSIEKKMKVLWIDAPYTTSSHLIIFVDFFFTLSAYETFERKPGSGRTFGWYYELLEFIIVYSTSRTVQGIIDSHLVRQYLFLMYKVEKTWQFWLLHRIWTGRSELVESELKIRVLASWLRF